MLGLISVSNTRFNGLVFRKKAIPYILSTITDQINLEYILITFSSKWLVRQFTQLRILQMDVGMLLPEVYFSFLE